MKDLAKKAIDHPIATTWIIGSITSGVARIIGAAKGMNVSDGAGGLVISVNNKKKKDSE